MLNWETLRCFLAVAERRSLSRAASDLGLSVATLGRRIDALEAALGVRVLRRGPKGADLTPHGARIIEHVRSGAAHLDQLERLARSMAETPESPPVRISSTEPMIADVLAPAIPALRRAHPGLRVELETSLELSNLNRGDADLAIRMVRPKEPSLVARKLPSIRMGLFATEDFLAARPAEALDIRDLDLLWYDSAYGDIAENVWLKRQGLDARVVMRAGSVRALMNAALAGAGAAPLPAFLATRAGLAEVEGVQLPARSPWLVFHRDGRSDRRLKAVRDWIDAACKDALGPA